MVSGGYLFSRPRLPQCGMVVQRRRRSSNSLPYWISCSLHRPPDALTVDPITSPWLFDLARKITTHQRPKKNTMQRMVFFFGIRRLPIFPPEAPTVRHGRSASPTLLELPALLDLLFASSSTGRAHSRSHHQPSASASLSQTQKTVIAVYETKETDGCQSLLFGIRRLPIFPGRHQPSIFGV